MQFVQFNLVSNILKKVALSFIKSDETSNLPNFLYN